MKIFKFIKNKNNLKAMTLIEVMVALSIFSIMSLLTVQTLTGGFKLKRNLDSKYTQYQTVRAIFLIMERDIRLIHHYGGDTRIGSVNKMHSLYIASDLMFNSFFVGTKERIDFTTLSEYLYKSNVPKSKLVEVSYYLEPSEVGLAYRLMRRKSEIIDDKPTEGGKAIELADNISSIEFKFFDINNTRGDFGFWIDMWDSTDGEYMHKFPTAVQVNITFVRNEDAEEKFENIIEVLAPNNFMVIK